MLDEIQERIERKNFIPFTVVTSSGEKYRVASRDHIDFGPRKSRVLVWSDHDTTALITVLHIVSLEEDEAIPLVVQSDSSAS